MLQWRHTAPEKQKQDGGCFLNMMINIFSRNLNWGDDDNGQIYNVKICIDHEKTKVDQNWNRHLLNGELFKFAPLWSGPANMNFGLSIGIGKNLLMQNFE